MKHIAAIVVVVIGCGGGGTRAPATVGNEGGPTQSETAAPSRAEAAVFAQTQSGGVLELRGDREAALDDAQRKMAAHCGPGNYQIISEGEQIVGMDGDREVRAWRLEYACAGP